MEERRSARVGTVSGLALLAGGTAIAAVAGDTRTIFSTILLGLLAAMMGHSLLTEIRRQARRRAPCGWVVQDTVNSVLLAFLAAGTLTATVLSVTTPATRAVGLTLTIGYAVSCVYFVRERRRAITTPTIEGTAGR